MKKLVLKLEVYDDGTLIVESKEGKIESKTNPETLTATMLLLAFGSLGKKEVI